MITWRTTPLVFAQHRVNIYLVNNLIDYPDWMILIDHVFKPGREYHQLVLIVRLKFDL